MARGLIATLAGVVVVVVLAATSHSATRPAGKPNMTLYLYGAPSIIVEPHFGRLYVCKIWADRNLTRFAETCILLPTKKSTTTTKSTTTSGAPSA
jgi:hypothetical protein